jgi:hypothetical protein
MTPAYYRSISGPMFIKVILIVLGYSQWCAGKYLTTGSQKKKKKPVSMYVNVSYEYILLVPRICVATDLQIILKHTIFFNVNSTLPIDFRRMLRLIFAHSLRMT